MSEKIQLEFDMDTLQMLQRAQVFHNNFVMDKAAFVADFPHLDDPFAADMQTAIDDADAIPSGAEVDAEIAVKTEELNAQLPLGRKALQKLYTYVELTWNSKARENEFGRGKYEKARSSQVRMKELLELANRRAEVAANKTALLASGYTQAAIDELKTIETAIDTLNAEQEDMMSARAVKTENRVKAMNAVWHFMQKINKASKVTFSESPAKIEQYLLYPWASQSLPKPQGLTANVNQADPNLADLSWDAVPGAILYKIYFSEVEIGAPSGSFGEILEVENMTATPVPLVSGRRNYWKVRAYGGGLVSGYSDEVWLEGVV